jgi:N-acetylglucosamine malate deacetylase 2
MNNVQLMNDPRPTADRTLEFRRPLIFVAHPDDETLGCGGLLQRMDASLVVFATDGAPPYDGLERRFRSLKEYSALRFQEAARALAHLPNCSYQRLTKLQGEYFVDQHLFQDLRPALNSLCHIARGFLPDALLSHAYEGGHIDHDACSFIASHAAAALSLRRFEFPLYWLNEDGKGVVQQFRDTSSDAVELHLTDAEIARKKKMLAEYKTQPGIATGPPPTIERRRPAARTDYSIPMCRVYDYRDWHSCLRFGPFFRKWRDQRGSKILLNKFADFELKSPATDTTR